MNNQNNGPHFTPIPQRLFQSKGGKSHLNLILFAVVIILSLIVLGGTMLLAMRKASTPSIPAVTLPPTSAPTPLPSMAISPTAKATDSAAIDTSAENVDVGSIEADLQDLEKELQGL